MSINIHTTTESMYDNLFSQHPISSWILKHPIFVMNFSNIWNTSFGTFLIRWTLLTFTWYTVESISFRRESRIKQLRCLLSLILYYVGYNTCCINRIYVVTYTGQINPILSDYLQQCCFLWLFSYTVWKLFKI